MKIKSDLPHSWLVEHWPANVAPGNPEQGRYTTRAHRDELIAAGALTRVGRQLVILGEPYSRWLQGRSRLVKEFAVIAPNRDRESKPEAA